MNNTNRVITNSIFLYLRIIITTLISLSTVPIVMHALGNRDYGLYMLIGGTITLLSFLKSSMTVSTQRFLSVAVGKNSLTQINKIYNNSIIIHYIFGICVALVLEAAYPFLFNGFLKIDLDRLDSAKLIYHFLVISVFFDITSVPYIGVINAKENMLIFSLAGILEGLLKLLLAISLTSFFIDKLIVYGAGLLIITFIIRCFYFIYVKIAYKELNMDLHKYMDKSTLLQIIGFTGWNTMGALALVGRNEGIAVILNRFFDLIENAAYGVANQINGVMGYVSQTFQKSTNPQLMKSYGMNDLKRLVRLSYISSKFSTLLFAFFSIPLIIEMEYILKIWLKTPAPSTVIMSQLILILSLIYQFSMGLMSAIQATGNIRNYQITISLLILLNVPITYLLFKIGLPAYSCGYCFISIELISLTYRIFMAKKIAGISLKDFVKDVLLPTLLCIICTTSFALWIHFAIDESLFRLISVIFLSMIVFSVCLWTFGLKGSEKDILLNFVKNIRVGIFKYKLW